jgi:hypothetical protein
MLSFLLVAIMSTFTDTGAWVVAIHKVLSQYNVDDPALDDLEAIITAGRAAELFSAVRSLGPIENKKYEIHRKLAGLRPSAALKVVKAAESRGDVDVEWSQETPAAVNRFEFKIDSNEAVLRATGGVFESLDPTRVASLRSFGLQLRHQVPSMMPLRTLLPVGCQSLLRLTPSILSVLSDSQIVHKKR